MGLYIGTSFTTNGEHYIHSSFEQVSGNTPSYVGIITHPSAVTNDFFGKSVAVGSGRIVVGAYNDDVNGIGNAGSALIYDLNGNYVGIITHPTAVADDRFGISVAVGSGRIVVGAYLDDVNGISGAGSALIWSTPDHQHILDIL